MALWFPTYLSVIKMLHFEGGGGLKFDLSNITIPGEPPGKYT